MLFTSLGSFNYIPNYFKLLADILLQPLLGSQNICSGKNASLIPKYVWRLWLPLVVDLLHVIGALYLTLSLEHVRPSMMEGRKYGHLSLHLVLWAAKGKFQRNRETL
jgi:hypothetical protein